MIRPWHVWSIDSELRDPEVLRAILEAPGDVELDMYQVSSYVNSVGNDGEECIERL